jgi:hypothetical protein
MTSASPLLSTNLSASVASRGGANVLSTAAQLCCRSCSLRSSSAGDLAHTCVSCRVESPNCLRSQRTLLAMLVGGCANTTLLFQLLIGCHLHACPCPCSRPCCCCCCCCRRRSLPCMATIAFSTDTASRMAPVVLQGPPPSWRMPSRSAASENPSSNNSRSRCRRSSSLSFARSRR